MAIINHIFNFDVATIQGWPLIKGGIYCTEHLACNHYLIKLKQVRSTMHVSVFNKLS